MFALRLDPGDTVPGVGLAFTDRLGGRSQGSWSSLNLGRVGVDPAVHDNLEIVRRELGLRALVRVDQMHTTNVHVVHDAVDGQQCPEVEADALVTTEPDVGLLIRVADCVPVLFASEDGSVVGAAHAGRVGLLAGVLEATVETMRGLSPAPLRAWIGPHICGDCYEVPEPMRDAAAEILPATRATTTWGTPAIDLGAGADAQLTEMGVHVERHDRCTRTDPERFFSHRVDAAAGRQAGIVFCTGRVGESRKVGLG